MALMDRKIWWKSQRSRYNKALIISGLASFISYVLVVEFYANPKGADIEISIFAILFQGLGFMIILGIANLLYNLGAFSEKILNPVDVESYRNLTFRIGYYFSIILPIIVPPLVFVIY